MTEFFKFAAECPLIACFIVVAIGVTLVDLAKFGMVSINRTPDLTQKRIPACPL